MKTRRKGYRSLIAPLSLLGLSSLAALAPTEASAGWKMTFNDEFSGSAVDTTKWAFTDGWGNQTFVGLGTVQCWVPEAASVANGVLTLTAKPQTFTFCRPMTNPSQLKYASGMISSHKSFSQAYGYFEMRAKEPRGKGLWSDFWMLSDKLVWPPETNIVEYIGNTNTISYHSFHWRDPGTSEPMTSTTPVTNADLSADFHTFGVDWQPGLLTYYVDGLKRAEYKSDKINSDAMYMLVTLAVGGNWAGLPDATTTFPAKMEIDYIRAYTRVNDGTADGIPPFGGNPRPVATAPTTLYAQQMALVTRTAGANWDGSAYGNGTGYGFWNNGYVQDTVAFPRTAKYNFTIKAWGDWKLGISPYMELRIDGKPVGFANNISPRPWGSYTVPINVPAGQHLLAVALTNGYDWFTKTGEKRSLVIDTIKISDPIAVDPPVIPPAKLMISDASDRSNGKLLQGAEVSGKTYVFASADTTAAKAEFWLDQANPVSPTGAPIAIDDLKPFDLGGSDDVAGIALPFDVSSLAQGSHTVTARVTLADGTLQAPISASFTVNKVDVYLSDSPTRSNPRLLRGATISDGPIYVYTAPDAGVARAEFWLDSATPTAPTTAPTKIENMGPFDLAGTAANADSMPFDATTLAAGAHTVTVRVTMADGTVYPFVVAGFTKAGN
ncbi:MAG: family 16 glycosylhydrolase [Methylotetracoccus sp.]